jgi:hypothetical protein
MVGLLRGPPTAISALIEIHGVGFSFVHAESQSLVPDGKSCSTVSAPRMFGRLSARGADDPAMEPIASRVMSPLRLGEIFRDGIDGLMEMDEIVKVVPADQAFSLIARIGKD